MLILLLNRNAADHALWYADSLGLGEVVLRCERYHALGGIYTPGRGLLARQVQNESFYGPVG